MFYPRRRKGPAQPAHVPAPLAMLARAQVDKPFGGFAGEMTVQRSQPSPPVPTPLVIPPPDWAHEPASPQSEPDSSGGLVIEPPPWASELALGPPVVNEPLRPLVLPEPDWRAEERERVSREREAKA